MKKALILAAAALLGGLSAPLTAGVVRAESLGGDACGTIVVWNHFHSGLPTAHVGGRIVNDDKVVVGQFVCRLEDNGEINGVARTYLGPAQCDESWEINDDNEYSDREIEVEDEFKGRHSFWGGEWEEESD